MTNAVIAESRDHAAKFIRAFGLDPEMDGA